MRILVLVEACGGVFRHVTDLCSGLLDNGLDVHLLYSTTREDMVLKEGLKRLSDLAVSCRAVAMTPNPGMRDLWVWWEIRKYIKEHGPFDVIHGHSSKGGALARLFLGKDYTARVYTSHAFVTMDPNLGLLKRLIYGGLERLLAYLGDAVIVTSTVEMEHAEKFLGIPKRKLFLIPNGIKFPSRGLSHLGHELRRAWGVLDDEVVIGTVVRFVNQKAPELLLRAFAKVVHHHKNVRLIMAGDGPMRKQLRAEADRLNISDLIIWPGFVLDESLMSAFDIFVLPSRYEGFPYVFLDALVAGLPLVATPVGGADMVVEEGINGALVPFDDDEEMARVLCWLASNSEVRNRMGEASFAKAKIFSADLMVKKTVNVYEELLN